MTYSCLLHQYMHTLSQAPCYLPSQGGVLSSGADNTPCCSCGKIYWFRSLSTYNVLQALPLAVNLFGGKFIDFSLLFRVTEVWNESITFARAGQVL